MSEPNATSIAVIFDVDGVLVDSYHAHFESWRRLAETEGMVMTEAQFASTFGRTSRDIIRELWPILESAGGKTGEAGRAVPDDAAITALDDHKEALYRELITAEFPEMPGARALIGALHEAGILIALGSSGPPENVNLVRERIDSDGWISAAVTGMDVTHGKPHPEVFLKAAEKLVVEPACCIVVEDAPAGIEAAHRGGMKAVALVSTGRTADEFDAVQPELIVDSLEALTVESVRELLLNSAG